MYSLPYAGTSLYEQHFQNNSTRFISRNVLGVDLGLWSDRFVGGIGGCESRLDECGKHGELQDGISEASTAQNTPPSHLYCMDYFMEKGEDWGGEWGGIQKEEAIMRRANTLRHVLKLKW